ncbi:MAG: hypothetical protein JWQ87_2027 [Candidatus Sulfotelmatobacter sp.]|nr:hypothetical protein [Candidatus Sulfotelmatobacter sp.]
MTTRAIGQPATTPKEKFEEAVYQALRGYQDGKFVKNGVAVGRLDQPLTYVYDAIVAAFVTALLDSAPNPPQSILVNRGEKFQIKIASPYQDVADPAGIIETYDCQINENADLVISSWERTVLLS